MRKTRHNSTEPGYVASRNVRVRRGEEPPEKGAAMMPIWSKVGEVSIVSAMGWDPMLLVAGQRFSACVARNRVPSSSVRALPRYTVRSARLGDNSPPRESTPDAAGH